MKRSNLEDISVKERLIQTGLELFSEYGYEAASTRMIAKASGITRSSISFYFETKEAYYQAVIQRAEEVLNDFLDPMFSLITSEYEQGLITPENARCHIFRLLKAQISWYYDDRYSTIVRLIAHEHASQEKSDSFYNTLFEKFVDLVARLIMTTTRSTDHQQALMLSLFLNGSVQSMGEHRAFTYTLFDLSGDPEKLQHFLDALIDMTLDNTKVILEHVKKKDF